MPSSYELRTELQQLVLNDLLGPAGGPEEEVAEPVRDRYLVGMLAPQRQRLEPESFDELAVQDAAGEEGSLDQNTLPAESLFPSSFGLTCVVPLQVAELQVTARWGRYDRVPSVTLKDKDGEPRLVWKRTPIEGAASVTLRDGTLDEWSVTEGQPEVRVRGRARRLDHGWMVTFFLINGQQEPDERKDRAWLFQPQLAVAAPDGEPIFCRYPYQGDARRLDPEVKAEQAAMNMLYRHHVEYAAGHGVSVHAEVDPANPARAKCLTTTVVPSYEVPRQAPPRAEDIPALGNLVLDMRELADTPDGEFATKLRALTTAYTAWIEERQQEIDNPVHDLEAHADTARAALQACTCTLRRIEAGIALLDKHAQAARAFRFANRAMWLQRAHSLLAEAKRRGQEASLDDVDVPKNRSWYPFQLAFLLLNLPALTLLHHEERSDSSQAAADLLWFPTGGGKTEAYLGLTAYTLGIRRLQGIVEERHGQYGVAVLMRYTLRLLTLQQFQRAAALICACEAIRREAIEQKDLSWGTEPFRLGLWVGSKTTPNQTQDAEEAVKQARDHGFGGGAGTPAQLTNCPWCGHAIDPGRHIIVDTATERTTLYCGDAFGRCLFSQKQSPGEGIPALVVDEEIYRRLPSLLIATVDKFAQMPWNGKTEMLFGRVDGRCPRHGFRSPEIEDGDFHPRRGNLPPVRTEPFGNLRPPDLVIQDELHLISGPLGTLVGLYETAVDELSSWEVEGRRVRPKVIASTATIRNARQQIHNLFLRHVEVFPPHGTDADDNFFARRHEPSAETPGRCYLGICAPGKRLKVALIRVYVAYLAAAQQLYERYGAAADPWMTLVGYFNSMRELGGMRRLVEDDVSARLRRMDERGLARRRSPLLEELTSRKSATDIPAMLDLLEVGFDPAAEERRKNARARGVRDAEPQPLDVLLATNMISVGVDVRRLGLMVVSGQPKSTSEYIQATSRVGRSTPGVVCTVFNWARPRDLSHYERFEHYHATFYKHVEALSVTPFAPRALDRGLSALLVSLIRLGGEDFNANGAAASLRREHPVVKAAVKAISRRAELVTEEQPRRDEVRRMLESRLDLWSNRAGKSRSGSLLGYHGSRDGLTVSLLKKAGEGKWEEFTCLNSLRDVEPLVGLILDDHGMDDDPERETGADHGYGAVSEDRAVPGDGG